MLGIQAGILPGRRKRTITMSVILLFERNKSPDMLVLTEEGSKPVCLTV